VFRNFSKIRGDIRKSRFTTGINDTGGEIAARINDTGGKFSTIFASVVDTSGKFAAGVVDTSSNGLNDTGSKQWNNYQTADNLK
jgi:hypothetical protein